MTLADSSLTIIERLTENTNFSVERSIELTAVDLYRRGMNVFPIPDPYEVRALAKAMPNYYKAGDKPPYIAEPLYYSRMHLCDETCAEIENKTGRKCIGGLPGYRFNDLFFSSNIAVMMGRTSGNLICIDCDSKNSGIKIVDEFINRNLSFWAFNTSRGINILFRVREFELRIPSTCDYQDVQIWTHKHYCVLPPSLHNSGERYTWLETFNPFDELREPGCVPTNSVMDLNWLGIKCFNVLARLEAPNIFPEWIVMMSTSNRKILQSNLQEGSRNTQIVKPAYEIAALIKEGLVTEQDGFEVLFLTGSNANPPMSESEIRSILKSALKKKDLSISRDFFIKNSVHIEPWRKASLFAESYNWRSHGRTGLIDKAVFLACCERSKMDKGESFRASAREICELANISSPKTSAKVLDRLQEYKLIIQRTKTATGAFVYNFCEKTMDASDYSNTTCKSSVVTSIHRKSDDKEWNDLFDDIFKKLGRVSKECWTYLLDNPEPSVSEISNKTSLKRKSLRSALPKLIEHGLVSKSQSEGLYLGEMLSVERMTEIAIHLGTYGKKQERRVYFKREREIRVNKTVFNAKSKNNSIISSNIIHL